MQLFKNIKTLPGQLAIQRVSIKYTVKELQFEKNIRETIRYMRSDVLEMQQKRNQRRNRTWVGGGDTEEMFWTNVRINRRVHLDVRVQCILTAELMYDTSL